VPTLSDERFEAYLKQFRPLDPEPLPAAEPSIRARRTFVLRTWATAGAAILVLALIMGALTLQIRTPRTRIGETIGNVGNPEHIQDGQPLTMRSANALMAKSPSFKAMVDDMAFRSKAVPLPKGKRSAVAVLGEEKIKL
jgi:hypothetical protein